MILAVGTDLIEIDRIADLLRERGDRFAERLFTDAERAYCASQERQAASMAARFCAKEAVMKCLGTGWTDGITFRSIEVVRETSGAVGIALHGRAAEVGSARGIRRIHLSLSHDNGRAMAFAVAED